MVPIALSIATMAAEKLVSAVALSLPAMVMALVIPRSLARNLPLRSIVIWFWEPVLEPTWKVMTLAEPSSRFLPFSWVDWAIRVSSAPSCLNSPSSETRLVESFESFRDC
ncbi:hypothetical protein D3C84_941530 [compost metagenome]